MVSKTNLGPLISVDVMTVCDRVAGFRVACFADFRVVGLDIDFVAFRFKSLKRSFGLRTAGGVWPMSPDGPA